MKYLILLLFCFNVYAGDRPNKDITPGAINPDVTQDNIKSTICKSGFSSSIRPPVSYTTKLKKIQIQQYGFTETDPSLYEEDHLIPLSIGGHPKDPKNLWPQPWNGEWGARRKDALEYRLRTMVCNGEITLQSAQYAFSSDWIISYIRYFNKQ
jgi:hypothetical protein